MLNNKKQLKKYIKKYPELFSLKTILFEKAPTKKLKISKFIFFISFITLAIVNSFVKTNNLVSIGALIVSIIIEITYIILFKKWLNANKYYVDLINIDYFLKHNIYNKNDYFICYGKLTDYNKSKNNNKTNLLFTKNNTILSAIILLIVTTLVSKMDIIIEYLSLNSHKMNTKIIVLIILFLILPAYVLYTMKTDFKSKKFEIEKALKNIEDKFFSKSNGRFKMQLLITTMNQNKTDHNFKFIEKYISDWQTNQMPK